MNHLYHVIFREEEEGGFTAIAPSLPGCVSYGKNLPEAQRMISDAIEAYIASLQKHGETIPTDDDAFLVMKHQREFTKA